jgi:hypothetical protein
MLPVLIYLTATVFENLNGFKNTFLITKLLFDGLHPDRVMFTGSSLSAKKLYLLYDRDNGHYNVITNLKVAMSKSIYVTRVTHTTFQTSMTEFASCVLLRHPVVEISSCIVLHVIDGFSVRSVFKII